MKEKLIKTLYDYWKSKDDDKKLDDILLKQITKIINEDGRNGAETLLDWCRDDFENVQNEYKTIYEIDDEEFQKIMEKHYGDYQFMYKDINYLEELEDIWDLCNWYLDYINGVMTEKELLERIN